jgi:hypothetical protein
VAACGEDGGGEQTAATATATAAKTAAATATETAQTPEAEIEQAAKQYLTGISDKDWSQVCESRAPSERRKFERDIGSCEAAFKLILGKTPELAQAFAEAETGDVRIKGKLAGIDILQPGQTEPALTLAAVRENGHWFLKDIPDSKTP